MCVWGVVIVRDACSTEAEELSSPAAACCRDESNIGLLSSSHAPVAAAAVMAGESRKWMILVATIWIQAFTGTNFDFSDYSASLKSVLKISQVQLNYLATASDLGKLFGWSSGLALAYLPLWLVMFMAAFMGLIGYGVQWLLIQKIITLPYFVVFLLCLLAGCSICWFNTVCFVLCIRNFPINQALALSLTVSFNGVTAALYTLVANSVDPSSDSIYLFLNALLPLLTSLVSLVPILHQPPLNPLPSDAIHTESLRFLILNVLAIITGLYLLLFSSISSSDHKSETTKRILLFGGAIFLLILPLCIPGVTYARSWFHSMIIHSSFRTEASSFILVNVDDLELHKELLTRQGSSTFSNNGDSNSLLKYNYGSRHGSQLIIEKDQLAMLGEEHSASVLIRRVDFWLYYVAYFCGGTIGLVYCNNLGQIAQSLGFGSSTSTLVTLYSAFSFFGRLLSAVPDYIRNKVYFARTGWLTIALIPTPIAFILLASSDTSLALHIGTALIGFSSGFIFATAISITSELFGPNSVGVNHNILITNIPIGSLLYGLLAALVYDANAQSVTLGINGNMLAMSSESVVCMGRQCYFWTFVSWACLSIIGEASSLLLLLRTKHAYDNYERHRIIATQEVS